MSLRFHWMLPKGGEVAVGAPQTPLEAARYRIEYNNTWPAPRPDIRGWAHFARRAEEAGIDSVLISFSRYEPDPFIVSSALGQVTEKLKYIVAYRSGLMQPVTFVQQVNTLSVLIGGRVSVNIVAGSSKSEQRGYGDFLAHDERYARAEEFLAVCNSFWRGNGGEVDFEGKYYRVEKGKIHTTFVAPGRTAPEIYVSGHSEQSEHLVSSQGSCWLRVADDPEKLRPAVERMRERGIGVCLRMGLMCRPTREEAVKAVEALLPKDGETTTGLKDDSQMYKEGAAVKRDAYWLTRSLWAGLVPHYGPVWTTLLGSPEELAEAFLAYKRIGVGEFIISGWPEVDAVTTFGREVLPLVREAERRA